MKNKIAKDLRTPKYRKRVVESKKVYDRKSNSGVVLDDDTGDEFSDIPSKGQNACRPKTPVSDGGGNGDD